MRYILSVACLKVNCTQLIKSDGNAGGSANVISGQRQNRTNFTSRRHCPTQLTVAMEPGIVAGVAEDSIAVSALDKEGKQGDDLTGSSDWWCFDTESTVHIAGHKDLFVHLEEINPDEYEAKVQGVAAAALTKASGIGAVKIVTEVGGQEVELFIDDVLYVPDAKHGLFSTGLAMDQGFEIDYDRNAKEYSVRKDDQLVIHAVREQGLWLFRTWSGARVAPAPPKDRAVVNYTVVDGVGSLQVWYTARGIEHVKVGPKSSHLNPCERAHQSLIDMTKTQMQASGFPQSF